MLTKRDRVNSYVVLFLRFPKYTKHSMSGFPAFTVLPLLCSQQLVTSFALANVLGIAFFGPPVVWLSYSICLCFALWFTLLQGCGLPFSLRYIMSIGPEDVHTCTETFICQYMCDLGFIRMWATIWNCFSAIMWFPALYSWWCRSLVLFVSCSRRLADVYSRCTPTYFNVFVS